MSIDVRAPAPEVRIRALVRDKHGRPKFDDPGMIKEFMHRLSDEDIKYLEEKYGGEYIYTDE